MAIKIKVCGMRQHNNILYISALDIEYMGFIFYEKSKRFVNNIEIAQTIKELPKNIISVGVFVNSSIEHIIETCKTYNLKAIQLHGNENVDFCSEIKSITNLTIIKAFQIANAEDFAQIEDYINVCDYVLFDTKSEGFGGSGKQFDWSILTKYTHPIPFFLSGGISIVDIKNLKLIQHPMLYCFDVNSKFEIEPALKNEGLIEEFVKKIKE